MAVRMGLQFLQILVLARLLAPADFGSMAVVATIATFLFMFSDLGVSYAIIHHQQVSEAQLSSLYWLNVLAGAVMALFLAAVSPLLAWFYREPVLQPLLALAGLNLFIGCLWQQLAVRAEKELRFARLAGIEITAAACGLIAALAIALLGGGVFALIGGMLASGTVSAVLAWTLLAAGWRPQMRLDLRGIGEFLRFGAYMVGNNLVNAFNLHVDVLLGGRLLGTQAMGLYAVPKNLCLQVITAVNPVITRVALPVMAKSQQDAGMLKDVYLQVMRLTASANFPLFVAIGLFAPEIVHLAFGPQWEQAIPVLRIFAGWALLRSTGNPVGSLLMARGRADLSFKWNLAWLFIIPISVWAGSRFGEAGIAFALTVLGVAGLVPNWYFLVFPLCGAGFVEYFRALAVPLAVSLAAGLGAYLAVSPLSGDIERLAVGTACGAVLYLALSLKFNPAWPRAMLALCKLT